jgi:hypothetical protein
MPWKSARPISSILATMEIVVGMQQYLKQNRLKNIAEIVGTLQGLRSGAFQRKQGMRRGSEEIVQGIYLIAAECHTGGRCGRLSDRFWR